MLGKEFKNITKEEIIRLFSFIFNKQELNIAFLNSLQNNKRKLAYFGAGTICRAFLKKQIFIPKLIIDNYISDTKVDDIPIISANSINCWSDYLIIITCAAYDEIEKQLQKEDLIEGKDYIKYFDIIESTKYSNKYFGYSAFSKLEQVPI